LTESTPSIAQHLLQTVRIGAPVVVSRAGFVGLVVIDTVMSGRAGTDELAYFSIASGPQLFLMMVGIGLLRGAPVLTAQAYGAGEAHEIGVLWRVITLHAFLLSALLIPIAALGEPLLLALGQSPELAHGGGGVMAIFSVSLPFYLVWVSAVNLLEGLGRTLPAMIITSAGVLANIGVNWIFVFGHWGAPAMGAEGAQLATTIIRGLMMVIILAYIFMHPSFRQFAFIGPVRRLWQQGKTLRRLGYPMGLATGIEALAFTAMTILAGLLGKAHLAAFQTANSLVSLVFMVAIGIGAGTAVRVAQSVGRGDRRSAILSAWSGTGLATTVLAVLGLVFILAPESLARLYVSEEHVIALATPVFQVAGGLLLFHGAQTVLMASLRGIGDVWVPTAVQFVGGWVLMLPIGATLAFTFNKGAPGLMAGLFISVVFVAAALMWRFLAMSRRDFVRL
jgi:multidrug resistance protein, MATE family